MGIGSRVCNYKEHVFETIEAKKKAKKEAESNVLVDLQGKIEQAERTILDMKERFKKKERCGAKHN